LASYVSKIDTMRLETDMYSLKAKILITVYWFEKSKNGNEITYGIERSVNLYRS